MPQTKTILFANGKQALAVVPAKTDSVQDIATALSLPAPKAVIISIGGADNLDEALLPRLTQLYSRGIARAAIETSAVVISGGTQSGTMALLGEGMATRGAAYTLVGVAPQSKVTYPESAVTGGVPLEPNHTHFILTDGDRWGSETPTLFKLAAHLAGKDTTATVPVIAIVAAGGEVVKDEVIRCVRQKIQLLVIKGSGGFADEICAAWDKKDEPIDDPVMAEIIADGDLTFHGLQNSVKGIERLIIRELGNDKVLFQAWEAFTMYDINANIQQKRFDILQRAIIWLGVFGTALVICQQVWSPRDAAGDIIRAGIFWATTHHVLILIPIMLTILVTAASRFKQGNKWLLLRAGAESIKREIYRYRARAMSYAARSTPQFAKMEDVATPEQELAKKVEEITRRTMRTEVNLSALKLHNKEKSFPPYAVRGGDDGFSYLTPDRYVEVRLSEQLAYFQKKTLYHEKVLRRLYWLTFLIGGIGTYLAAVNQEAWVALTTSLVAAFGTYLGYRQTESTLTKYNQTATDLRNVRAWWDALSAEDQASRDNIDKLVKYTEDVLQSELDGWIQQMQNALADLRKNQSGAEGAGTAGGRDQRQDVPPQVETPKQSESVREPQPQTTQQNLPEQTANTVAEATGTELPAAEEEAAAETEAPVADEEMPEEDMSMIETSAEKLVNEELPKEKDEKRDKAYRPVRVIFYAMHISRWRSHTLSATFFCQCMIAMVRQSGSARHRLPPKKSALGESALRVRILLPRNISQ